MFGDMCPEIVYENYGPYKENNKILVIKQFQNLKPIEVWEEIKDFPYQKVKIYCLYENVEFAINNVSQPYFKGDVINGLKQFALEINGELVEDLETIKEAKEKIGLKAGEMWDTLTNLDFEEAKVKYLEQRSFGFINLCRKLGLYWKPTAEMLAAVKDKQLNKNFWPRFNDPEEEILFWRNVLDPRIDFKLSNQNKF